MRRVCEQPQPEDFHLLPAIAGQPFRTMLREAVTHYRDDSFLLQFLTPKVVRDLGLFAISTHSGAPSWTVDAVQDLDGFREIRSQLARSYLLERRVPEIEVFDYARTNTRALTLRYRPVGGRHLDIDSATRVMRHVKRLWNFPIRMLEVDDSNANSTGKLLLTV